MEPTKRNCLLKKREPISNAKAKARAILSEIEYVEAATNA
jgi:hypothetical protein